MRHNVSLQNETLSTFVLFLGWGKKESPVPRLTMNFAVWPRMTLNLYLHLPSARITGVTYIDSPPKRRGSEDGSVGKVLPCK